jgi:hypothetical protein
MTHKAHNKIAAGLHEAIGYTQGWNAAIQKVAEIVQSGAGMADLIPDTILEDQADMIRRLRIGDH